MARAMRAGPMRDLYREAVRQGFVEMGINGGGHPVIQCPTPRCGYPVAFSISSSGNGRGVLNLISRLRHHGLLWEGRGGGHTAPLFWANQGSAQEADGKE